MSENLSLPNKDYYIQIKAVIQQNTTIGIQVQQVERKDIKQAKGCTTIPTVKVSACKRHTEVPSALTLGMPLLPGPCVTSLTTTSESSLSGTPGAWFLAAKA